MVRGPWSVVSIIQPMNNAVATEGKPSGSIVGQLLQSGIIYTALTFVTGLGNYGFNIVMGRYLGKDMGGEYGYMFTTNGFVNLLGLPLGIATYAVTHYIARFRASGQEAELQGLLAGCRKFLFHLTVFGSVLAIVAIKPLGDFFHIPRSSLVLVAVCCVIGGLWSSFAAALCQGLAWFKRLALIGLLAMVLRLSFGWVAVTKYPMAEAAVAASAFMLLANLVLLFWRKELTRSGAGVSPWNRQFVEYLIVGAAVVGGTYCFTQGDLLVAQRYFPGPSLDLYGSAGLLARALPMVVGPLLVVLFTSRSGHHSGSVVREQLKLLGLYAAGLFAGAAALLVLRGFLIHLQFNRPVPEAAAMVAPLALTMVFSGLLQALGMWALASRWLRVSLFYGGLALAYWVALLVLGRSPAALLRVMPIAAGIAFVVLFLVWLTALRGAGERE